jgi:GDPmannose 4,6-dehydratase
MSGRALITGVAGQDGSLLAELLIDQEYEVVGVARGDGTHENLRAVTDRVEVVRSDLLDPSAVRELLEHIRPSEVYNLASPSFSPASWEDPVAAVQSAGTAVAVLLEAIRTVDPAIRLYQASSSEMFGDPVESPQSERTPVLPLTPYGAAKACAHFLVQSYRRRYGLFACSGILYNHESERRSVRFLPRKVAHGAAAIALGLEDELLLGDLSARRDWGSAYDYVRAMWTMLLVPEPDDYVIATGTTHSVEELVECAFRRVGLDWKSYVRVDEALRRGSDQRQALVGDASKARAVLGWSPTVTFEELVHRLVDSETRRLATGARELRRNGRVATSGTAPLALSGGRRITIEGDELDLSVLGELRNADGIWEPHLSALFERIVRPDWSCIDIGANIGVHTLRLAELARRVVAFEAGARSSAYLRVNVRTAGVAERTTVVEAALWDSSSSLGLVVSPRFAGAAYLVDGDPGSTASTHPHVLGAGLSFPTEIETVRGIRLDDWVADNPLERLDLLKIDVEGAEQRVLAGATSTLDVFRPFLVTEYNPDCARDLFGYSADAYYEWLREHFETIEVVESGGALSAVRGWDELRARLEGAGGWVDLLCTPAGREPLAVSSARTA